MRAYRYFCNTRIEMAVGAATRIPEYLEFLRPGATILLVTDPGIIQAGLVAPIYASLEAAGYGVEVFSHLVQNPRDADCLAGTDAFHRAKADCVIGVGGGSAMDTAKTIALLGRSGGTPAEYADGVRPCAEVAPIVCVPTTAGTGSEVTRSAVITELETHRKMTLKHASLRPTVAVLDPTLTFSVPASVTAATGVDALVHAIEGYTCRVTQPISQALGARAMETIVRALPIAYAEPQNVAARADMLEGSLLAGLCFGSADVAAVHCLAEALGGLYDTPHGVANAVFLPHVLRFNALAETHMHATLSRTMGFAKDTDEDDVAVELLIDGVDSFTRRLNIPRLRELPGVNPADFPRLVELAAANGSTPSNVRPITENDYQGILETAYQDA